MEHGITTSAGWREKAALALGVACSALFVAWMSRFYPVHRWLFWRYLGYFGYSALFLLASLSVGHLLLRRLLPRRLPLRERAVQSVAVGLVVFALGWFLLGLLGLLRWWTALLWPVALVGAGLPVLLRTGRRLERFRALGHRPVRRRGPLWLIAVVLATIGLALIYLPLVSPENVAFDARFYHQAMAEHYAAQGYIGRFEEGWFPGINPQIASWLYTWVYALPYQKLFDRMVLSQHLEFALFVYTLASVPVLVRRLAPRAPIALSWVAMLVFPGLYCYDASLTGAADHVAAALAVPIMLALLRALPLLEPRACALLGVLVGAAALTKYTAYGLVTMPGLAVGVRTVWLGMRAIRTKPRDLRWLRGPLVAGALVLAISAAHWLKNLLWYGDPLYPFLHGSLAIEPWVPSGPARMQWLNNQDWMAERSWGGLLDSVKASVTFSFFAHDWWNHHRDVPVFGSLFTFSVPFLLLIRRSWPLALVYGLTHLAIVQWFWTFHQERYLQAYLPWMAAGLAAVTAQVWQLGLAARAGVLLLASLQLIWGGDVPFFPSHSMLNDNAHKASIDLLSSGFRQKKKRLKVTDYEDIGAAVPEDARLLLHDEHLRLGFGRPVIADAAGLQGGIEYAVDPSPAGVYSTLRALGVTHLVWVPKRSMEWDSLASDIAFHRFAVLHTGKRKKYGAHVLAAMPETPPPKTARDKTLVLGCGETYASGLYDTEALDVFPLLTGRPKSDYPPPAVPLDTARVESLMKQADVLVVNPNCHQEPLPEAFKRLFDRGKDKIYYRARPKR